MSISSSQEYLVALKNTCTAKVKPLLVPRFPTDSLGLDADVAEADGYRCVSGCAGSFGIPGLDIADHAASGVLPRRQYLLGLRAQPGDGGWVPHREFAGPPSGFYCAITDLVCASDASSLPWQL